MTGLSSPEAAVRLAADGPNALPWRRGEPWHELRESLTEPLVLLLIAVAVLYALFGAVQDALIILGVLLAVAGAETWTEIRAGRALARWRSGLLRRPPLARRRAARPPTMASRCVRARACRPTVASSPVGS